MGRAPCCDKAKVKRGSWSPEEDTILKNYVERYGTGCNWIALPHKAGLKRCGKSCRLRWLNYLRPDIKHGGFTEEEDNLILTLYTRIGSRWSVIASHMPGRTDNDVKNYWNTKLKKKLLAAKTSLNTTTTTTTTATATSSYGNCAGSDSILSSMPYTADMNYQQNFVPHFPVPNPIQFPLPRLMEGQESGTEAYGNFNITVSPLFSLEKSSYAPWSGDGGGAEGGFFMETSRSHYDLPNGFYFQEKIIEASPRLAH
ncbi:unnamed protein product [Ilex paraguariensis]|uniref:Uncharacterized protein n=1 Tax=Ilex paraguariensis TaxID=185542 RepID=A0ABC8TDR8_9AQUA